MGTANRRARANAAVRRRISAVPLRWRLTLVSILVLIPVLAIYGAALYVQVNATLLDTTANGLRTSARPAIVQQLRTNTFRVATPTATGASATPAPTPAVAAALPSSPAERSLAELARMLTTHHRRAHPRYHRRDHRRQPRARLHRGGQRPAARRQHLSRGRRDQTSATGGWGHRADRGTRSRSIWPGRISPPSACCNSPPRCAPATPSWRNCAINSSSARSSPSSRRSP
ncbi:MAG: hypothetical protein U0232_06785 [Thermomicrobiales bacterium]